MMTSSTIGGHAITFPCGLSMKNQFMLAPMTNSQSHDDGSLSDDEFTWLTKRSVGGFGLTMTCASHVQTVGRGFPGQLGIFSDGLLPGHRRLAAAIRAEGSLAVIQLHHAGLRSPHKLIGERPVAPSAHEKSGARELTIEEVEALRDDFIAAAVRSKTAGYDGVQIHGAHGYIIAQFLSPQYNRRTDRYGGSLDNRSRLLREIIDGVRARCGATFLLGVRLSPERFGMRLREILQLSQQLIDEGKLDFLDLSLWDCFKQPEEVDERHLSLLQHVLTLERGEVKLTVAGKIHTAQEVETILSAGIDFVTIGRAAIIHHDYPRRVMADPTFRPVALPVSVAHLEGEGLGPDFIEYMRRWDGFVQT